ncbi:Cation diffusion facilitator family transporter precursor [Acidilobus saccharovorans 345-15]|uniref:Cation diffusion facilitator family transporter n=1 Tax=Acidilobus saccharovorans (strain DSM 16705 / JCM 18335 / VKM B-2471 / 345-15) TaxID=666510 RepID=D9PZF6_ACIS3|nr:cation transporter [Acidilobus saccharovorans]ADL18444.1 Cation diffusion facilitator family transporter precursor [Acidilobus saccharovorans 345-15]
MISRSLLRHASRLFLVTGLAGLPLAVYELYLGLGRGYYLLQADGYHALFDSLLAVLYAVLLKVAYRRSRSFPWGLYNAEGIVTILVSIFVVYLVASAFADSLAGPQVMPSWTSWILWASAALSASVAIAEVRYMRLLIVKSDLMHASVDTALDLVAGGVISTAYFSLTPVVLGAMMLVVLYNAAESSWTSLQSLLGAEVFGTGLREAIGRGIAAMGLRPLRIYVARAGSFYLVQAIIALPPETTLARAYRIKKRVSRLIASFDGVAIADVRVVPSSELRQQGARARRTASYL